jgi:hypothetical protein
VTVAFAHIDSPQAAEEWVDQMLAAQQRSQEPDVQRMSRDEVLSRLSGHLNYVGEHVFPHDERGVALVLAALSRLRASYAPSSAAWRRIGQAACRTSRTMQSVHPQKTAEAGELSGS